MLDVLSATVPIFLVVAVGYACTRAGLFARADMTILNRYVVRVALPLLVFVNVAGRSFGEIFNPTYLLTYALASLTMLALAALWCAARRAPATRTPFVGMAMGGTNNGFVGAVEADDGRAGLGAAHGRHVAGSVIKHPMVIAILLALALNALGWAVPAVLQRSVGLLAQSASGVALFAIGGLLAGLTVRGARADIAVTVVGKLLVMPAVGFGVLLSLEALGLPAVSPALKAAVIITTALPTFSAGSDGPGRRAARSSRVRSP